MTSAGSPGKRCCSEKIRIDTKNSVGISCAIRRARKLSISSLQLQPDDANQPVRHLPVALEPGGMRNQDLAVIEVENGFVVKLALRQLLVDPLALRAIGCKPRVLERLIGLGIAPNTIILRSTRVQEDIAVAIRIDTPAPGQEVGLVLAGFGLLQRSCKFGDPDFHIE